MALTEAAVELSVDVDRVERDARTRVGRAGENAGRAFDEGFKRGVRNTGGDIGDELTRDINGKLRNSRGRFVREGRQVGENAGRGFSDGFNRALNFELAERAITTGLSPLRGLVGALGFSLLAGQAAAATAAMLQFSIALAPVAGIVAAFPAGIALASAAFGTLAVALSGVGEVFSSALTGDAAAFEEALEGMSPAVVSLARELRVLAPEFQELRNAVQEAFFSQLQGRITAIAAVIQGPLQAGMVAVSTAFGVAAVEIASFVQQGQNIEFLNSLFESTRVSIEALTPALQPLLTGFRDLAAVGLSFFPGLSASIADTAASFGTFLSNAAASGQALSWIENARAILGQLGGIAQSVGGILQSVFQAAGESGGDFLGSLGSILGVLNQFAASAQGQEALVSIFQALGVIGGQLGGIIATAVTALGPLAPIIGQIATALGPGVQAAIQGIGEALQGIGPGLVPIAEGLSQAFIALGPALGPLGAALGQVLTAISPILPIIGELAFIFATALTQAILGLLPVIEPLVDVFVDHMAQNLPQLLPVLLDLVGAFSELLVALVPIIVPATQLVSALISFGIAKSLVPGLRNVAIAIRLVADYISFAVGFWQTFFGILRQVPQLVGTAVNAVSGFVAGIPGFFAALPARILGVLQTLPGQIVAFFATVFSFLLPALETGALAVIEFFFALPGRIIGAVFSLIALWIDFVGTFWSTVTTLISDGITGVINFFVALPGQIMGAIASLPGLISGFFTSLWENAKNIVTSGINGIISIVTGLPDQLIGLAGRFSNAGQRLIQGFFEGLEKLGSLGSNLGTKVLNAIKSGLNRGIDAINSGIDKINGKLPGSPIPRIPRFAKGGIVDEATLGIVGEAGPELIMPLSRSRRRGALQLAKKAGVYQMIVQDHEAKNGGGQIMAGSSKHTEVHNHFTITSASADPEIIAQRIMGRIAHRIGA